MSTAGTALVWRVEPADSWPAGDLLGDTPTKLVPEFEDEQLTDSERRIWDSLLDMGGIGDEVMLYGAVLNERFEPGDVVDVFDVHEALVDGLREEDGPFGEIAEVLYGVGDETNE